MNEGTINMPPCVYICSPYKGDVKRNKEYARILTRVAIEDGCVPITPHLYITEALDDEDPKERYVGLSVAMSLLRKCDRIYIGGKYGISEGMKAEIEEAGKLNLQWVYLGKDGTWADGGRVSLKSISEREGTDDK